MGLAACAGKIPEALPTHKRVARPRADAAEAPIYLARLTKRGGIGEHAWFAGRTPLPADQKQYVK